MKLLSVNVSQPRTVEIRDRAVLTGIYKEPVVASRIQVRKLGLDGDGQADLTVHGGEYQALYGYPHEHYAHWQAELGVASLGCGTFGENLTTSGLLETEVCIGDVHRIGSVLLQVTSARIPCFKLGHKLNRPDILKPFLQSGRSGFYYKVLQEGTVAQDDEIQVEEKDPQGITVRALLGVQRLGEPSRETMERAVQIKALAPIVRNELSEKLQKG